MTSNFLKVIRLMVFNDGLPDWSYLTLRSGHIVIIDALSLKRRYGSMTTEQLEAIRQEIHYRLTQGLPNTKMLSPLKKSDNE